MTKNRDSIENDIKQLEEIVAWFESDDFALEQAIDRHKEAQELADKINQQLLELKNTIEKVIEK
ncbi:exodeoxyribonuclease VII small subunit [Candidatus Saccharibacteria bacterium]|jgi:exodeoxyribonuclease VII small subunit|nr:exodeoxyribonuclease VII small subunit [Candidatus Saccharibacteria bacterium]